MSNKIIPKFVPEMEPYCIWGSGFSSEECDEIKNVGELAEFEQARVGGNSTSQGDIDSVTRQTDIAWILPRDNSYWFFDRMASICSKVNFDKFQLDLAQFDGFQYSKYKVNGHYDWHIDTGAPVQQTNFLYRKLSAVLMLSNPDEYEGGEFQLSCSGDESKALEFKPKKGDIVFFYSHIPHKVNPVTSGERITLVTWAMGDKIK